MSFESIRENFKLWSSSAKFEYKNGLKLSELQRNQIIESIGKQNNAVVDFTTEAKGLFFEVYVIKPDKVTTPFMTVKTTYLDKKYMDSFDKIYSFSDIEDNLMDLINKYSEVK